MKRQRMIGPNELEPVSPLEYRMDVDILTDTATHILQSYQGEIVRIGAARKARECLHASSVCRDCIDDVAGEVVLFQHSIGTYKAWKSHYTAYQASPSERG